jgi:hypothetical protein
VQKSYIELVDEWTGRLIVSIGAGKFREEVALMVSSISMDSFDRGMGVGKEAAKSRDAKDKLR